HRDREPGLGGRDVTGPETAPGVTAGQDDGRYDADEGVTSAGPAPAPDAEPAEEVLSADEPAIGEKIDPEAPWQRLSWRMLLVYPLGMLTRLLPLFLISLWLGSNRSNYWFEIIVVSLVILSGVLRWLSTSYQVGSTHIILKKGFFSRQVVTVARQRIRSVDTES